MNLCGEQSSWNGRAEDVSTVISESAVNVTLNPLLFLFSNEAFEMSPTGAGSQVPFCPTPSLIFSRFSILTALSTF